MGCLPSCLPLPSGLASCQLPLCPQELLNTYSFTKIASWSSGSTYFHMALGSLGQSSRLLCETSLVSTDPPHTPVQHLETLVCSDYSLPHESCLQ